MRFRVQNAMAQKGISHYLKCKHSRAIIALDMDTLTTNNHKEKTQ